MRSLRLRFAITILFLSMIAIHHSSGQTIPRQISYQGLLTAPSGTPVTDGDYTLILRLYDAPTGGNQLFEEQQTVTVSRGLFTLYIGAVTSLDGVDFTQPLWLETAISGQTPFLPRTRLAVVPYAIHAESARAVTDDITGVVRSLNGADGDLEIKGEGAITVLLDGDTIRIMASITGAGIEQVVSSDNTLTITGPLGPVTDVSLSDGAVTEAKLADGSVSNTKLAPSSVTTSKIQSEAVTANKIAPGVIPTTLPPSGPAGGDLTGNYPNPLVAPNAINSSKIADGSVSTADLSNGAVTNAKLGDASVTSSKLADNAVTNTKLAPESVSSDKLTATGVSPGVYGSGLLVPRITVDAQGRLTSATQVNISNLLFTGPAGGDLTGTYPDPTIRAGAVTTTKIADQAVTTSKLQDGSVTSSKILNGTILLEDLSPGLIPTTLPPSGPAGGILAGSYPNPSLNSGQGTSILNALNSSAVGTLDDRFLNLTGVTAGTYGNGASGLVPRIQVDKYGRVLSVVEQQIMSAVPTGAAGGDLAGTYPNPIINASAAAGNRMVDAVRADYLAGDPDINTPSNIVVLDGSGRLPSVNGSQLTNLSASAITSGVLPIERGGTNSSTSLNGNRLMVSSGGKIVESSPIPAQNFLVSTGLSSLPVAGTIVAGGGINVAFSSPNFVISATNAPVLSGTTADQTLRWDGTFSQWKPTSDLRVSATGDVTATGSVSVSGALSVIGNTNVGSGNNSMNAVGSGSGSTNAIGSSTSTNYIYGATNINTSTGALTSIGTTGAAGSSTRINVGTGGNLQLNGIGQETAYSFLVINTDNNVRQSLASGLALEGLQFQNGAFRLGTTTPTANPYLQDRFINLGVYQLSFTRLSGSQTMFYLDAGAGEIYANGTTNINTTSSTLTTIGNGSSRTVIGGQLDPRGPITNTAGNVVILDQTEIIGPTFINSGTDHNIVMGQQGGTANQSIALSVGQGPNGNIFMHNVKVDPFPLMIMSLDASNRVRVKSLTGVADEGLVYESGSFRLGSQNTTMNPFLFDRFVNIDDHRFTITGDGGSETIGFFDGQLREFNTTANTNINTTQGFPTNIGNPISPTSIGGTLGVIGATTINNTLLVQSNQANHVASIINTNNGNGDGLLIKLGRTHGAWNGSDYLDIPNPASVFFGSTLTTIKGWLNGASFSASNLWTIFPASALAGALAQITNSIIGEINSGLGLPLQLIPNLTVVPQVTVFPGFHLGMPPGIPDIHISSVTIGPYSIGPYSIPAIPTIPTGGLPTINIPNFSGTNVANSLTRENHYITFQDVAGRQTGAIMAESVNDWRDNTVLDDVYVTQLAGAFVGIDLLGAAMLGFSEIVDLIDSYNNIGVAYESGNGDYAEWLERADPTEFIAPGDVVGVRAGKISKDIAHAEQVMVVSHHPIVRGNMPQADKRQFGNDVAFMGQVPVKVLGSVRTGDYLVASGTVRGYAVAVRPDAMTAEDHERVVGRAWEASLTEGPKYVNAVVGVHNGDWAKIVQRMERSQDELRLRLERLENRIELLLGEKVLPAEGAAP
jgi:hypothetical protein